MVVKTNFDSEFCGNLPLQHINQIQDYGFLLVLELNTLTVIQASENCTALFGGTIQELMGKPLSGYLPGKEFDKIKALLSKGIIHKIPLNTSFNTAPEVVYHALLHIKTDYLIIELEKAAEEVNSSFTEVFQEIKYVSAAIEQARTVQEVCEIAIRELRKLSGFDGILMYRFDENWNGTVIAEDKDPRLEPYLGQTFPASDVPKQARQLYLKNPYRLIPNRDYTSIRLYPVINPVTNAFIDLSDCNLRSVVAVHLEYMKNMKIKASMSIRVIHNESLWGLISCHHIEEKYLNYEICSTFEWLSAVISNKISLLLNKETYEDNKHLQDKRAVLTDQIYAAESIADGLLHETLPDVLDLFKASGAIVILNGHIEKKGNVPDRDTLDNLIFWLEGKNGDQVFSTDNLAALYEDAQAYATQVSGLLVIPIDSAKGEFLICFRPEVIEDIHWGGNPNQAINFEKDGKSYHPRNSFKMWKQTVHQQALPWSKQELEIAASLRSFLFEFRTKQLQD